MVYKTQPLVGTFLRSSYSSLLIVELHLSLSLFFFDNLSSISPFALLHQSPCGCSLIVLRPVERLVIYCPRSNSMSPSLHTSRNKSVTVVHHEPSWVGIFHPSKQNGGMRTIARGASKGSRQRKPTSADQDPVSMHAWSRRLCPRAPCTTYSRMMMLCDSQHRTVRPTPYVN